MNRIVVAVIVVIVGIVLVGLGAWYLHNSQKTYAGEPESITIGMPPLLESAGLLYIADDQHFFADNGLNVTIKEYDVGFNAVKGMINNENNVALASEFVIVENAFKQEKILGIGSISKSDTFEIIGRKDKGIVNESDLRGKKVGLARGTISDFYLGRFLELHGMNLTDVTLVDTKSSQLTDAIGNGTVDAIVVWGPYVYAIKEQQGSNAVIWPAQSGQLTYWNAICRSDWAAQHPELISRFLKSIDQAAEYTDYHPAEAKAIVQKRMHAGDTYIDAEWQKTQYRLSLDAALITAMEDEGRWMIKNNLTSEKMVPDFGDYFYLNGLEAVNPKSVNIIP